MDHDRIVQELLRMEKEAKAMKLDMIRMTWYMRGGITLVEIMESSQSDRELIADLVKENLETTKKSGLPFY